MYTVIFSRICGFKVTHKKEESEKWLKPVQQTKGKTPTEKKTEILHDAARKRAARLIGPCYI